MISSLAVRDPASEPQYFPAGLFNDRQQIDELISSWYSRHLKSMHEPSLWELRKIADAQLYRFLWIGTWTAPFCVRLEAGPDGTTSLCGRVTSGLGGYDTGSLSSSETKILTPEKSKEFFRSITASGFWTLPTKGDLIGNDGAQWIFEGVRDGQHHLIDRWSPGNGAVRDLGLCFLTLSGLPIPPDKLY